MLTDEQIRGLEIQNWDSIADQFKESDLLLGNGFSLNFSPGYRYSSLFSEFLKECNADEKRVFQAFDTTNFESIQETLLSAQKVNTIFNKPTEDISSAITKLRNGLIISVQKNHPRARDMDREKIDNIASQIECFKNIFTLSYDIHLYHIIMNILNRYGEGNYPKKFQDYFWGDTGNSNYKEFRDYQNYKYKHVYYLHGALFLFSTDNQELKVIRRNDVELLDCVSENIYQGKMPLFVSEGTHYEKYKVIRHNPYLNFAFNKFREGGKQLVIYGFSLSSQDQHIINTINERQHNIAISIYIGDKNISDLDREISEIRAKLRRYKDNPEHNLMFFDSSTLFQSHQ